MTVASNFEVFTKSSISTILIIQLLHCSFKQRQQQRKHYQIFTQDVVVGPAGNLFVTVVEQFAYQLCAIEYHRRLAG
jgi:hypothetical protein